MLRRGKDHPPLESEISPWLDHTILILLRLQSELMTMMLTPTPGISAFPDDGNMLSWTATITGPTETPYSGLGM